jgi:hypothetical protein
MTETQPETPQPTRNFQWSVPIAACRLSSDDIKRLHRIIDEKQIEDREHIVNSVLQRMPEESPEQFQARRERVPNWVFPAYGSK